MADSYGERAAQILRKRFQSAMAAPQDDISSKIANSDVLKRLAQALAGQPDMPPGFPGTGQPSMGPRVIQSSPLLPPPTPEATATPQLPQVLPPQIPTSAPSLPPLSQYPVPPAPTPQMAPVTASAPPSMPGMPASAPPMAPPAQMASAAPPAQPVDTPVMPASTPVDNPSVRDDMAAALASMKQKGMLPASWKQNFGNFADQQS